MTNLDPIDLDLDESPDSSAPLADDPRSQPLRYSVLKAMKESPAHARHLARRRSDGPSLAMRLGSGTHALLLGGKVQVSSGLSSDYVSAGVKAINAGEGVRIYKGAVRRGKEWNKFLADNDGHTILTEKEHEQAQRVAELERSGVVLVSAAGYEQANQMADSIRSNEVANRVLLQDGVIREQRIDWEWNGRSWRSTPDAYRFRTLAELKTTRCADPERFHWDALRMAYNVQLAIYRRAIEQTTGVRPRDIYLFAVESKPPYVVTPFKLTERSLEHGDRLSQEWHDRYLQCEASGNWPGYVTGLAELDVYDPDDETAVEVERAMANDTGERAEVSF
jgi:hypothetical protein